MPAKLTVAGYPTATVYALGAGAQPPAKLSASRQLLWGDYITVLEEAGDFYRVRVRGTEGWMRKADTQSRRLLEIVFVDIGQGDGALVITPDNRKYVVDAGIGDNMHRFLRWRFGRFKKQVQFDAAIMSHSDEDHYGGFARLFGEPNLRFRTVYTNGLMERKADKTDILGRRVRGSQHSYISDLVPDLRSLKRFLADTAGWQGKKYPTMLQRALANGKFDDYRMLDVRNGYLPGHEQGQDLEIQVLGPWPEEVAGKPSLRWLGDVGKTKNGHSVLLRFVLGDVTIFMGGDLNTESARLLLEMHTQLPSTPGSSEEEAALVAAGRRVFACDIAKACHHGSADVFLPFLKAINPIATVVSSGDDEPHAHPRADALGAIGKCARGDRPLIFSTELSRSAKETVKSPRLLRAELTRLSAAVAAAPDQVKRDAAQKKFDEAVQKLERSIAVYGAINLRTDGNKVVMAYKLERPSAKKEWDIYLLEPQGRNGPLAYRSKHDS